MSTKATIRFKAAGVKYFLHRYYDGCPDNVLNDFKKCKNPVNDRSESEFASFVALFESLPDYERTTGFHGDESYRYEVSYDKVKKTWKIEVL